MDTYRVSELAERTGFSPATLRYYEEIGLLDKPGRSPAGYRIYGPSAEERLRFIARAKRLGLSLDQIRELVKLWREGQPSMTREHLGHVVAHKIAEVRSQMEELATFLRQLEALFDRVARGVSVHESGSEGELPDLPHVTRLRVNEELKLIESSQCTCGGDCGLDGCSAAAAAVAKPSRSKKGRWDRCLSQLKMGFRSQKSSRQPAPAVAAAPPKAARQRHRETKPCATAAARAPGAPAVASAACSTE